MLTYPFFSLFLPLNEDLYPCIMLMFSWGEPRLQAGPSDLAVDHRGVFLYSPSLKNLPSLSPLPAHLSEVGQGEENGDSLLPQESSASHAASTFCVPGRRCLERAWLLEGTVLSFLKMALFPVALSWAGKPGAVSGQLWLCPPFLSSLSSCLPLAQISRALQVIPCFSTLHLHTLPPARSLPLLPTTKAPKRITGSQTQFDSSLSSLKCKLQKAERPWDHVGVCLPGRGLPRALATLI